MRDVAGIKPTARIDGKYIYVFMGWGNLNQTQRAALNRNGFRKYKTEYRAEITAQNAFFAQVLTGYSLNKE